MGRAPAALTPPRRLCRSFVFGASSSFICTAVRSQEEAGRIIGPRPSVSRELNLVALLL